MIYMEIHNKNCHSHHTIFGYTTSKIVCVMIQGSISKKLNLRASNDGHNLHGRGPLKKCLDMQLLTHD